MREVPLINNRSIVQSQQSVSPMPFVTLCEAHVCRQSWMWRPGRSASSRMPTLR